MKYVITPVEFKIPPEYTHRMLNTKTTDIIQMAKNFSVVCHQIILSVIKMA